MRKTKAKATAKRFARAATLQDVQVALVREVPQRLTRAEWLLEQQMQFKQKAALLVGRTCNAKGEKVPLTNKPVVPGSDPMIKPAPQMSPECLAAQERAKQMAADAQATTRAQELELKQRINEVLAVPCATK